MNLQDKYQISQSKMLIFLGLILFLLGLIVGLFVQNFNNPRMALAAHLEGLMNGIFLIALGLIWMRLRLARILIRIAFGLIIYGAFANLLSVTIAAATGYGKMMPLAGGKEGQGMTEIIISFLLITLSLSMLIACILIIIGFYRHLRNEDESGDDR